MLFIVVVVVVAVFVFLTLANLEGSDFKHLHRVRVWRRAS